VHRKPQPVLLPRDVRRPAPRDRREQAEQIVELFDVLFPLLSVGTTPLAIGLVNRYAGREHAYLGAVVCLSCAFGLTQLAPSFGPQLVAAVLFGPARTLQWACYFHFLASPSRYPPAAMGRVVGYANLVIALFGDLPPSLLDAYIQHGAFPSDVPSRYVAAHAVLMTAVALLSAALPLQLLAARRAAEGRLLAPLEPLESDGIIGELPPSRRAPRDGLSDEGGEDDEAACLRPARTSSCRSGPASQRILSTAASSGGTLGGQVLEIGVRGRVHSI